MDVVVENGKSSSLLRVAESQVSHQHTAEEEEAIDSDERILHSLEREGASKFECVKGVVDYRAIHQSNEEGVAEDDPEHADDSESVKARDDVWRLPGGQQGGGGLVEGEGREELQTLWPAAGFLGSV